jgi:hypothetical protein
MRRAFEHPLAPALGCAVFGLVYLLARPATADMAAHSYRVWLFQHEGLTVWNAQWYGGHHVLGYSLLFAPLAAQAGPALVGVTSAVIAVAAFVPLARSAAATPSAAAAASWLFAAGVLSNLAIGRMPFLLGVALAMGAWWCESRGRGPALADRVGAARARRHVGEPGGGRVPAARRRRDAARRRRAALGTARAARRSRAGRRLALWLLFPEGGTDRFTALAFWPMLALSAGAVALLAPRRRIIWAGGLLYLAS